MEDTTQTSTLLSTLALPTQRRRGKSIGEEAEAKRTKSEHTDFKKNPKIYLKKSNSGKELLNIDEAGIVKKALLSAVIERELETFRKSPTLETLAKETLVLDFLHKTVILDFPLVKGNSASLDDAIEKLILSYPKINNIFTKAVDKHSTMKTTTGVISNLADGIFRTNQEINYAKNVGETQRFTQLVEDNINVRKVNDDDEEYQNLLSARKLAIQSVSLVYQEAIKNPKPIDYIFSVVRKNEKLESLPSHYQGIFDAIKKAIMHQDYLQIINPETLERMRKLYHLYPRRSLKAVLTISNPFKLAGALTSLFLMKPFGMRNLFQRLIDTAIELPRTEIKLKDARHKIPNQDFCSKIEDYVIKKYVQTPSSGFDDDEELKIESKDQADSFKNEVLQVLRDETTKPTINPNHIAALEAKPEEIKALYEVLRLERRRKDKITLVDLFGEPEMVELIQGILPAFLQPFESTYEHAKVPALVTAMFTLMKQEISIGSMKISEEERKQKLQDAIQQYNRSFYSFVRNLMTNDNGTIRGITTWLFERFRVGKGTRLDIQLLMEGLTQEQINEVKSELDVLVAHHKEKERLWKEDFKKAGELEDPPHTKITQNLLQPFLEHLEGVITHVKARSKLRKSKKRSISNIY